jgi:hypothetical protein
MFDRSRTTPDEKRCNAAAAKKRANRFSPARSAGVFTAERRTSATFAARCLTTVHQ